jgi:hypothetical protein
LPPENAAKFEIFSEGKVSLPRAAAGRSIRVSPFYYLSEAIRDHIETDTEEENR